MAENKDISGVQKLIDNLSQRVGNFTTLRIETRVGTFKDGEIPLDSKSKGIVSEIRMLDISKDEDGKKTPDMLLEMSEEFATDSKYKSIMEYHLVKENQAQEIYQKNLDLISKIGSTFMSLVKSKNEITKPEE